MFESSFDAALIDAMGEATRDRAGADLSDWRTAESAPMPHSSEPG
jgi:hypothetical protein